MPLENANGPLLDRHDKESVNVAVQKFVTIINDVAMPFKKKANRIERSFNAKYSLHANWFDDECRKKKQNYTEALRQFNMYKTLETRRVLYDKKTEYKKSIRRKHRAHNFAEMKKIKNL